VRLCGALDVIEQALIRIERLSVHGKLSSDVVFLEVPPPHSMQSAGLWGLSFVLADKLMQSGYEAFALPPTYLGYVLGSGKVRFGYKRSEVKALAWDLLAELIRLGFVSDIRKLGDDEACALVFACRALCSWAKGLSTSTEGQAELCGEVKRSVVFAKHVLFDMREEELGSSYV
jgi:hypothetical protein